MKASVKIVLILLLTALLINWMREGGEPIARVLPFMGGRDRPALFEVASIVMILIALRGFARLKRAERRRREPQPHRLDDSFEPDQDDEE